MIFMFEVRVVIPNPKIDLFFDQGLEISKKLKVPWEQHTFWRTYNQIHPMKFTFKQEISMELVLLQLELFSELPVKLLLIWPKVVSFLKKHCKLKPRTSIFLGDTYVPTMERK